MAVLTMHHVSTLSQKEGTVLLLADILCACYGWEAVPGVREPPPAAPQPARVDPSYVNNPSLADVTFRLLLACECCDGAVYCYEYIQNVPPAV